MITTNIIRNIRGLRQGDQLSQYLVIICAEELSSLIRQSENRRDIRGVKICRNAPIISHMLFADDFFFFFRSTENGHAGNFHSKMQ
jgi:hypothetical protein